MVVSIFISAVSIFISIMTIKLLKAQSQAIDLLSIADHMEARLDKESM